MSYDNKVITYSWKVFHCEVCKTKYRDTLPNPLSKGQTIHIFEISKPENNYIILESFVQDEIPL